MGLWPQIRTVLIGLHVLSVLVLASPNPHRWLDKRAWESENAKRDLQSWTNRLSWLGYHTREQLERDLWSVATAYTELNRSITKPFHLYASLTGARQGWAMFSNPQKHPAEVWVDIYKRGRWIPVYRPFSRDYDFWRPQFRQNRVRKLMGRFARTFYEDRYNGFARFVATQAATAFPEASRIRVRMYRYAVLPPSEVSKGIRPEGRFQHTRVFAAAKLR